ncbi:tetratricopeptide repeat protein [Asticcacaulis sp. SL142]|uniref:tetratricopeptide repeat protein n=1 Tax=Asticcacaulis sp. SL142 TaxID=2995155 RepID=UPI00226C9CE1|nr:tetratricopeptide repeat protein [Asticcacaulis sp. SL142]WAC49512.1 tetratricopeptide repeat protein [Asticcacaulis sp. SL142]
MNKRTKQNWKIWVYVVPIVAVLAGFGYVAYDNWGIQAYPDPIEVERKAAEGGKLSAQVRMAEIYDYGFSVPVDKTEAAKWYRLAAEQGHGGSQYILAEKLMRGEGVPRNEAEAFGWYQKAGFKDHAVARFKAADMLERGIGTDKNLLRAYVEFSRLAKDGDQAAAVRAQALFDQLTPEEKAKAAEYLDEAVKPVALSPGYLNPGDQAPPPTVTE